MKCFLLALLYLPACAFADGGLPSQPYIYVEGRGSIQKTADMVKLQFSLGTHDPDQAIAGKQMREKAAKVLAMLDGEKVAESDVDASDLSSRAEYEQGEDPSKHGKFKGYSVTRSFDVAVRNAAAFPKIIDQLLAIGVEEFSHLSGELSDLDEQTEQAQEKALADARKQAEKTLKSAHMKIDSVFAISPYPFPQILPQLLRSGGGSSYMRDFVGVPQEKPDPLQFRLPPVEVAQTVHVIYLISPAP